MIAWLRRMIVRALVGEQTIRLLTSEDGRAGRFTIDEVVTVREGIIDSPLRTERIERVFDRDGVLRAEIGVPLA